jgi:hypothetical protein
MPRSVASIGGKLWFTDNRETPDTLQVTYEYPGFIATYENRNANGQSMFNKGGGILFCGSEATLYVDREGYRVIPEGKGGRHEEVKSSSSGNLNHWANFLECVRTRQRPASDIEKCFRSTSTCLLATWRCAAGCAWTGTSANRPWRRRPRAVSWRGITGRPGNCWCRLVRLV